MKQNETWYWCASGPSLLHFHAYQIYGLILSSHKQVSSYYVKEVWGWGNVSVNISKLIHIHPQHNRNKLKLKQMTATFFNVFIYSFHLLSNRLIPFSGHHLFYFENYVNIICQFIPGIAGVNKLIIVPL